MEPDNTANDTMSQDAPVVEETSTPEAEAPVEASEEASTEAPVEETPTSAEETPAE